MTSVTYRLTPDDMREARRGLNGAVILSREVKFLLFFPAFLAALMMVGAVINFLAPRRPGDQRRRPGRTEVVVVCVTAAAVLGLVVVFWNVRKGKGAESPHEITAKIEPEGLRLREGDLYDSRSVWGRFAEIRETPTQILLVIRTFDPIRGKEVTTMGYPIPKRAFDSPEAAASFLETARRWHAGAIAAESETGDVKTGRVSR